jgi:fatty-acyl-CoA synthase
MPGSEIRPEALSEHCRALASSYKVPDRIEIRAALPVTETGKLSRRALKEEAQRLIGGEVP